MINERDMGTIHSLPFSKVNSSLSPELIVGEKTSKPLRICVDYDDVLVACTAYAVRLANIGGYNFSFSDITSWGETGKETDVIFQYFESDRFYETQPVFEGAVEFLTALKNRGHEILILTAIGPQYATIRANRIKKLFPMVDEKNIIIGSRKDLVSCDILIDDAEHNITDSPARYPICVDRPWNKNLTGVMRAFSYEEIISFIDRLANTVKSKENEPKVYCLVGPSGSGKTLIADELSKAGLYKTPRSTTTRQQRVGEPDTAYNFVSKDKFNEVYERGGFLETTVYAGNSYGMEEKEITSILSCGYNAVCVVDMSGANAIKMKYGNRCTTVFVKRPKAEIIDSLLKRLEKAVKCGNDIKEDIKNRILAIDSERKNQDLCDMTVLNNRPISEVIKIFL